MSYKLPFWLLLSLTIVFSFFYKKAIFPLSTADIISYELAKTVDNSRNIMQDWQVDNKMKLFDTSLYLDFIFILLYTLTIALGSRYLSSATAQATGRHFWWKTGHFLSRFIFVGAACDIFENIAMLNALYENPNETNVFITYVAAIFKFIIIATCVVFICVCGIILLVKSFSKLPKDADKTWDANSFRN